jgi:hypothetical protein
MKSFSTRQTIVIAAATEMLVAAIPITASVTLYMGISPLEDFG